LELVIAAGISSATIVPITTVAARWFDRYRGRAMTIPLSASGFAGFLGVPLINKILAANGGNWRQAWLVVAAIAVTSGIIALLLVNEYPADLGQAVDGMPQTAGTSSSTTSAAMNDHIWTPSEA
jgi:MFS family permease